MANFPGKIREQSWSFRTPRPHSRTFNKLTWDFRPHDLCHIRSSRRASRLDERSSSLHRPELQSSQKSLLAVMLPTLRSPNRARRSAQFAVIRKQWNRHSSIQFYRDLASYLSDEATTKDTEYMHNCRNNGLWFDFPPGHKR